MNKFSYNKVIQRYCPHNGWEDVSEYDEQDMKLRRVTPKEDLKEYRFSEPAANYRMINRRVLNGKAA